MPWAPPAWALASPPASGGRRRARRGHRQVQRCSSPFLARLLIDTAGRVVRYSSISALKPAEGSQSLAPRRRAQDQGPPARTLAPQQRDDGGRRPARAVPRPAVREAFVGPLDAALRARHVAVGQGRGAQGCRRGARGGLHGHRRRGRVCERGRSGRRAGGLHRARRLQARGGVPHEQALGRRLLARQGRGRAREDAERAQDELPRPLPCSLA